MSAAHVPLEKQLIGTEEATIDEKGRLLVSKKKRERLGEPFVSGREEGLGIGYFLSHASVNQWGGSIRLRARPEGGTLTTLRLPWPVLQAQPLALED